MYQIKLDLFQGPKRHLNPIFNCEDWEQLINMINFFFDNGYDVYVRKSEDEVN